MLLKVFSPPMGLGCHAVTWLMYTAGSTTVWMMMVLSASVDCARVSILLRGVGKVLAATNAFFLIVMCLLNALGLDRTCYCGSGGPFPRSTPRSTAPYIFSLTPNQVTSRNAAWVGGMCDCHRVRSNCSNDLNSGRHLSVDHPASGR